MTESTVGNLYSLEHLTPTDFENLCFDLLKAIGCINIDWRKGTNTEHSPADGGRDIECSFEYSDPDGSKFRQEWFVECKHHKNAIPATELQAIMTAALTQDIDVLLIATSGFLSNPAKEALRDFSNKHKSKRIKKWERKDIEYLVLQNSYLMNKYQIGPQFPFLSSMNQVHAYFISDFSISGKLEVFFNLIEKLSIQDRDEIFDLEYWSIINPKQKVFKDNQQTLEELMSGDISYIKFKEKCLKIAEQISESFIVRSIVSEVANRLLTQSDESQLDRFKEANVIIAEIHNENPEWQNLSKTESEILAQIKHHQHLYALFCEKIILKIVIEHREMILRPNSFGLNSNLND